MRKRLSFVLSLLFLIAVFVQAQSGKLRGRVVDKESGEPLIGASVALVGTNFGAATDVNGDYVILNVPPGTYSIKTSFVGYADVTISNVRINSGITTTQDIQMSSSSVQVGAVVIVAERPLIQRNTTNTIRLTGQEEIQNLPIRGVQNILSLNAGVVQQNGNLYVRGGRSGEVSYYVENAPVSNVMFEDSRKEGVSIIQEAIEEIQLESGGFTAEYGNANSGIVKTTLRTGGNNYKFSVDYQTDDFAGSGSKFLGTNSYGYRNVVLTAGGPVVGDLTFFIAAQHNYVRQRDPMFLKPFSFANLKTDRFYAYGEGIALPGTVEFKENAIPKNWDEVNTLQGTIQIPVSSVKVRVSGSYSGQKTPQGHNWPNALTNYFWKKNQYTQTDIGFGNVRVTHTLNDKSFYEVGLSYYSRTSETYDDDFGNDWRKYVDSAASVAAGYTVPTGADSITRRVWSYQSRFQGPAPFSTIYAYNFTHPYAPVNTYNIDKQTSFGGSFDYTNQLSSTWEVKGGARIERWTMRLFNVGDIASYNSFLASDPRYSVANAKNFNTPALRAERDVRLSSRGQINHYGYDVDGNEVDDGVDRARTPVFASAYAQNKMEFRDLVLNVGLRYEYYDQDVQVVKNYENPDWDNNLDYFKDAEKQLVSSGAKSFVLPRISFSFPVTEKTVFYAQYGKYAQLPNLGRLYSGSYYLAQRISPKSSVSYTLTNTPAGAGMFAKPERTTQYEMGIRNVLSENLALSLSGFYKDVKDQIQIKRVFNSAGVPIFVSYLNEDFSTIKGVEITLELRRTNGLMTKLNYTLSDARGSASTPASSRVAVSDDNTARFPNFINPFDFNQTHRGTIFIDYRWMRGEGGPILEGLGANLLLSFNSGHNYTKILEPLNLGQASVWNIGVRPLIDPRTRNPVEPINSSTTPWVFNLDLNISKTFWTEFGNIEVYVNILNVLNTRNTINVFPNTGTPTDDGWLRSTLSESYRAIPNYTQFYQTVNIDNRAAYITATGFDVFSTPRQTRFGVKVEL